MRVRTENLGVASPATSVRAYRVVDDVAYFVTRNLEPPMLGAFDLAERTVTDRYRLPADASAWAIAHLNGDVFLGPEGDLYRVDAAAGDVERACEFPGDRVVCDIDTHGDTVVAGTYPTASLYEYDAGTGGVRERASGLADERYVRNVRVTDETIYAGSASRANLFAIDRPTGEREEILPAELADESSTRTVLVTDDAVVSVTRPSHEFFVVDRDDHDAYRISHPDGCDGVTNVGVRDGSIFVAATRSDDRRDEGGVLYRYDVSRDEFVRIGRLPYSSLDNGLFFRNGAVVGCKSTGIIWTYDLESGETTTTDLGDAGMPAAAEVPQSFGTYDGAPVIGAHRKLRVHDGGATDPRRVVAHHSPKAVTATEESLYVAMYVDAVVGTWEPGDDEVAEVATIGDCQNRPRAIHYHASTGTVFVGTVPEYGYLGGALTAVRPADETVSVERHAVENQSVCALTSTADSVYLGSEIHGEKVNPVATEARLAAWDPVDEEKRWEVTPVSGAEAITDLVAVNDEIWGTTDDGDVFTVDARTRETTYRERVGESDAFRPRCRQLAAGGGSLYCTTDERLFAIDPSSRSRTVLLADHDPVVPELAIDAPRTLFTFEGRDLLKVRVASPD